MLISQPALLCLEATWRRIWRRPGLDEAADFAPDRSASGPFIPEAPALAPALVAEAGSADDRQHGTIHEQARLREADVPLTAAERRARAAALRALALSRVRQFDAARAAFMEASRLDPVLDLTRTPSFWTLERAAHEAAIAAYDATGRDGDAAILRARIRSTYRPKPLRPQPGPVLSS